MKIGCVNFYDEVDFIDNAIDSLIGKVDKIVLVDGAYKDFEHTIPWSTDGTLDIIEEWRQKYPDIISVINNGGAWENEIEKRNAYFVGQEGDYYIVLDADERLEGSTDGLEKQDDWQVRLFRMDGVHPYFVYRIFRHRQGIRYFGTHHAVHIGDELINKEDLPVFEGVTIQHFMDRRSRERKDKKGRYYKKLYEQECGFRKAHYL